MEPHSEILQNVHHKQTNKQPTQEYAIVRRYITLLIEQARLKHMAYNKLLEVNAYNLLTSMQATMHFQGPYQCKCPFTDRTFKGALLGPPDAESTFFLWHCTFFT